MAIDTELSYFYEELKRDRRQVAWRALSTGFAEGKFVPTKGKEDHTGVRKMARPG